MNVKHFLLLLLVLLIPKNSLAATLPYVKITFPPSYVLEPKQISFEGTVCSFGATTCGDTVLEYEEVGSDTLGNDFDDYRIVAISGFKKLTAANNVVNGVNRLTEKIISSYQARAYSPPPAGNIFLFIKPPKGYEFKVVFRPFKGNPNSSLITTKTVSDYLSNFDSAGANKDRGYPSTAACSGIEASASTLCLKTEFEYKYQGLAGEKSINQTLIQSLKLADAGIQFQGNTATPLGSSRGYGFSTEKAIALGTDVSGFGRVKTENDAKLLQGYTGNNTSVDWEKVDEKLTTLHKRGMDIGSPITDLTFDSATFFLNSSGQPDSNTPSSFSAPPEGKLWKVEGNYSLARSGGNQAISIVGSGTVVINGNLTINSSLSCDDNTRIGFLVKGNIIVNSVNQSLPALLDCGVFTALGNSTSDGTIDINGTIGEGSVQTWNTILIARSNINLPIVEGTLKINYYSKFANNPTVLFKDLLEIVFNVE